MRNFELCSICENQRLPLRKSARTSIMFFLAEERRLNRRVALKLLLIFSLFIFHFSLIGQSLPDSTYTGTKKENYSNGHERYEMLLVKGKLNGVEKYYFESGKLMRETPYKDDRINGVEKIYFENGGLQDETTYVNGSVIGDAKTYFENGKLRVIEPFKDGRRNGIMKCYNDDGTLSCQYAYVNGKRNGLSKFYYGNGKLFSECNSLNDSIVSERDFDASGNEIKVPAFIGMYSVWTIRNNSDSLLLLNLDTLKLTTSTNDFKKSSVSFYSYSSSFSFVTNSRIDSALIDDSGNRIPPVINGFPFKSGTWKYDQQLNLLNLVLENNTTLNYFIQTIDSQNVLLIKKK